MPLESGEASESPSQIGQKVRWSSLKVNGRFLEAGEGSYKSGNHFWKPVKKFCSPVDLPDKSGKIWNFDFG
jgi:hypothetical protein